MKKNTLSLCIFSILCFLNHFSQAQDNQRLRAREYGIEIGVIPTGPLNSITDVKGIKVGQVTLDDNKSIKTGVTAILPHDGNIFQEKVTAAVYVGNGFGKLAGSTQVKELGNLETPIILTNTLSVSQAMEGIIDHTLSQKGNEQVKSVNALVGETNDGNLNDIRGRHVTKNHVLEAISSANSGLVEEGNVGAGTGTVAFGFKGGIGTSSRKLPADLGGYTVGVLVQSNFGGVLEINGLPVGKHVGKFSFSNELLNNVDGSIMIVVATDAPLDARNLERLAKRAFLGMGKTGGIASNGSGDYVIAFTTHPSLRVAHSQKEATQVVEVLRNDETSPLFMAAIEATEEAIINSLFRAQTSQGVGGRIVEALPIEKVLELMKKD